MMKIVTALLVVVLVLLGFNSMFLVNEGQNAVLLQFGRIVHTDYAPGLHFKLPLLQQVLHFDDRILSLQPSPERYTTADKKSVNVDYDVKWRVMDRMQYYRAIHADALQAAQRLTPIVKGALRDEVSTRALPELVSADPHTLTDKVRQQADVVARKELGIAVVEVGVERVSLPDEVDQAVYKRMREERQQQASQLRSSGDEAAVKIKADADRDAAKIRADADRDAAKVRGDGDAQAAAIYAQAYSQDPEFFAFYRSMAAYKKAFANGSVLVLKPDSEFLKYFNDSSPKK